MGIPSDVIEAMLAEIKPDGLPADVSDIRAALAAAEAKGWKLVPREATDKMEIAGAIERDVMSFKKGSRARASDAWQAMHDAAPSAGKQ